MVHVKATRERLSTRIVPQSAGAIVSGLPERYVKVSEVVVQEAKFLCKAEARSQGAPLGQIRAKVVGYGS